MPQLALDQDDLEQYIGVPAMVVDLTYDADAGEVTGCNQISVGLYKVFQLGQAGFGVRLEVSYISNERDCANASTTSLSDLSKVEIDKGTVEIAGCVEGPPSDDLATVQAEAFIVEIG